MSQWPGSESALAPPVIEWLEGRGFDPYQEVQRDPRTTTERADLVGVNGRLLCVVELKRSLGLDVIAQAVPWRRLAHMVWVAVPAQRLRGHFPGYHYADNARRLAYEVAEWKGVGVVEVAKHEWSGFDVNERLAPALNRFADAESLRKVLAPQHKTSAAAGSQTGGHWTVFRQTCDRLRSYAIDAAPIGVSLKDAIQNIPHHYASNASARSALAEMLRRGIVKGVRLEKRNGKPWIVACAVLP